MKLSHKKMNQYLFNTQIFLNLTVQKIYNKNMTQIKVNKSVYYQIIKIGH